MYMPNKEPLKKSATSPQVTPTPTPAPGATEQPGYTVPTRTLRSGYVGDDVRSVQLRLTELGYYTGTTTAVYDTTTMAAVRRFQLYNGLDADGVAGSKTFAVLYAHRDL